jgi:large repetitive protein
MFRYVRPVLRALAVALLALGAIAPAYASPLVLLSTFQDSPDPVASTQQLTYELQVSNNSLTTQADGVQLSVPIPAGATFVSVSDAECSYASQVVTCSFGTLPDAGSDPSGATKTVDIVMTVTAAGGSTLSSTAVATSTTSGEVPSSLTQITTVSAGADLALTASGSPSTVVAGGLVTYTLNASNLGPDASSALSIVDTLPPNVTYVSSSGSGWSCSASGATVNCNNPASLPNGSTSTLTIAGRVQSSSSGNITDAATLSAGVPDGFPNNNTATATVSVSTGADLTITKTASPNPMIASAAATFTLLPRNVGPDSASTVSVTDTLPTGFTGIAASGTNWSCSVASATVTCSRATLPVGATDNITISATAPDNTVVPPAGMAATNTASISASSADPDSTNNSGAVNFTIQRDGSDLSIAKTKSPNPVAQGAALTSVLQATNNGPRAVGSGDTITITDTLPTGETYSSSPTFSNNGWTCTYSAPVFTCTLPGPLAVGAQTPTVSLVTTATGAASLTNQGCVALTSATLTDPNSTNNCTSAASSSTAARADLRIVKTQNLAVVASTDTTLVYTLTISNNGPQDSANVVVTDVIPMQTALAGGTIISAVAGGGSKGSAGTCSVSGATVTCNYAALLFATGTPANSAETASIAITVRRPMADGAFTNTATINSTTIGDPDRSNNSSQVNTTVDPVADVQLQAKTVSPNPVRAGVDTTYVITYGNAGPSSAQNVTLSDQFNPTPGDAGYTIGTLTSSKGTCAFNAGSNLISCTVGTLAANEVETLTFTARPTWMASPPSPRVLANTATVATTTSDSDPSNDSKNASLNITAAQVDLIANISDVPSFVGVNADPLGYDGVTTSNNLVTYATKVTNGGPSVATGVTFQNSYLAQSGNSVTFLCDSTDEYSCTGTPICAVSGPATAVGPTPQVVNCSVGSLDANASSTRYLRYQINTNPPAAGSSYVNTVTVSSNEVDSNSANNSASEPTAVRAKADLTLTSKTAVISSPPLQYGQTFQWQMVVTNNGPGTAYQSTLTDNLPANMALSQLPPVYSISSGGGSCTASTLNNLTCSLGDIAAASSVTVTVSAVIPQPSGAPPSPPVYSNTASVSTFSVDLVSSNNSTTGSVSLVKSSIAGRVYADNNNNGTIDSGEPGIAGVTLSISGTDVFGNTVTHAPVTSDASGNYLFDSLEQANSSGYTITETQPSAYADGLETAGTASTGTPPGGTVSATVGSNTITAIVLDKNQVATGYNFGELRNNKLSGTVFADINNNGIKDTGDPGIAGVTVTLTGTDARGTILTPIQATTNAAGAYSFSNVLPGTYQIAETQPAAYADGIDTVGTPTGGTNAVNDQFSGVAVGNVDGAGYNFAELGGSISGQVWRDVNRNGALDAGEGPIVGATLNLSGAATRTTVSDSSGNYVFDALPAGSYTVTQTLPAGFGNSTPLTIGSIAIIANGTSTGHNFGDTTGAITGSVFFDRNGNGTNDGSDSPIAGVTFTLAGTTAGGAALNQSVPSDASGNFAFNDLVAPNASGYTLTETQPAAYANGQITAGTAGGTVTQSANKVSAIALTAGTVATGYRFAELGTVISGTVYRDANRNGAKDPGDVGIAGITVTLKDSTSTVIATASTAADGTYSFPPQPASSYTVVETQPTGYQSGPENATNSVAMALTAGTPATVNFGESAGSFAGTVFLDSNNNGVQDSGEVGLPGVTVTLTGTDANGLSVGPTTTTTSASGSFSFSDLLAGTYVIKETQPAAFGEGLDVLGPGNVGGTVGTDIYSAIALPAGAQATGYNFAETGSAVTGTVFRDSNRDGTQQPGDQGIAAVTVTLQNSAHAVVATTTTAADGSYLFAGVASGNYFVVEAQPVGYGSSASSPDTMAIVVPAGGAATARFADTLSTLAGSVYVDLNGNGSRDSGEPGINGVSVTISGTDAAGQAVNRVATSDASGNFLFIDLLTPSAAGYSVAEPTQPAAYADGLDAAGTAGGSVANDLISAIHLAVNTDATGYTFGERGTTVAGIVFKDVNGNNVRDTGDPGLPGVILTLKNSLSATVGTATTAADGTYSFSGLPSGNYTVVETQPIGYGSSLGSPDSVSVTVAAGAAATANFAETTSSLAGQVYADTNNNGKRDPGEPAIAGVTITLSGTDARGTPVSRTAVTSAAGDFSFADVLSGTYTLTESQPATYAQGTNAVGTAGGTLAGTDVISNIGLLPGNAATGYLYGERGQSITGHVWLDSNRNGTLEAGEGGISGVSVTLRDSSNSVVATTVTAADGSYDFSNIPAGHYSVVETQPVGYGSSNPDTVALDLTAAGAPPIVNFGDTAGSLSGSVYTDANGNNQRDPGEPGLAGVSLQLSGTDARGNAVTKTTTTAQDGSYSFKDVVGGTYSIAETQPPDYTAGGESAGSAGGVTGANLISAIPLGAAVDAVNYLFAEHGAAGALSGTVWRDANHNRARDSNEDLLSNWIVELYQGSLILQSVTTDTNGHYEFDNVTPGSGYEIRFREPTSRAVYGTPVTNESGLPISPGVLGPNNPGGADPRGGTLLGITLTPGERIAQQSLPVDPMGVVYDSVSRQPIAGATVTLVGPSGFDASSQLLGGTANLQQITGVRGFYQFILLGNAPAGTYTLQVTPPPGRYTPGESVLIPACAGALTVGSIPAPALVQAATSAPAATVPNVSGACPANSVSLAATANTTQYFYGFMLSPATSAAVVDNNVPIDPILGGALVVTKTTPMVNVSVGDLVPYTITATNTLNATLTNVDMRDLIPPGFAYRAGSASVNGIPLEPQRLGRQLTWINQTFAAKERRTYKLVLIVGAGVGEAEYVNQAFGLNNLVGTTISNVATAAVRVVPDPVFDCADIIGKVFDDRNVNGYQDAGEPGIPNVRLATTNGILVTTDAEGRFHVACAAIPNAYRGSNFVMKLDERTLPSGYRVTTENPRDVRITTGKMSKLNFGAAIHRVVRIEVSDAAYLAADIRLKPEWEARIAQLPQSLRDKPSVVRIAYAPGSADRKLVARRKRALIEQIREQWEKLHCCYQLQVEDETEPRR